MKERMMQQSLFHGILLDLGFMDPQYPQTFPLFARKIAGDWGLYGIKVARKDLDATVTQIQSHMRMDKPFYNHLYDDEMLIVIFKERIFHATTHASSWHEVRDYGRSLGVPVEQLDFWPNRFQDEIHYFGPEDFIDPLN
jgi:hypothetical protein